MIYGYAGLILRIDLSINTVRKEPLSESLAETFIGGRGFVAKILYDEIPLNIEPFDPENMLIAATGPLTGHFLPASGKTHIGTKSPATGGYADSNMGGHFGPQMKYAGYDIIVITGKAERPSYLFINDDTVEIRPAADFNP
jgi:aldehyde:ferredoxin oxidoreductase